MIRISFWMRIMYNMFLLAPFMKLQLVLSVTLFQKKDLCIAIDV
jgi:hypothetical protein